MGSWRSLVPIILAAVVGCGPDSNPTAADGPAFSHTGIPDINGVIFSGAGRRNLCSLFQNDPQLFVRASTFDGGVVNAGIAACPDNGFTIPVDPGSYFLRVSLPLDQPRGRLPLRWLDTTPVNVEAADAFREIRVRDGVPLGGGARVDGVPTTGVIVTALYQSPLAGAAGQGISSANGTWDDAFQGGPLFLQGNVSLGFSGCVATPVPGIRQIDVTPGGSVVFPTEANALNCDSCRATPSSTLTVPPGSN